MQELEREISAHEAALQRAVVQNAELSALTKSAAWGMLLAFVTDQTTRRMNHIMTTAVDGTNLAEANFMRGECSGLNLVKKYLEDELSVSQEAVELYRQAVSEEKEE